jgi:hypothetical protein
MDMRLEKGKHTMLPKTPVNDVAFLFYVFGGKVQVDNNTVLETGESMLIEQESPAFLALETSDIVLFITQTSATHFDGGMYSGNQKKLLR